MIEGKRLDRPRFCPDDVFEVMRGCWRNPIDMRTSFTELVDLLKDRQQHTLSKAPILLDEDDEPFPSHE